MGSALVLVATPFHASQALKVLEIEGIDTYEVVYLAAEDSVSHRTYFERISSGSSASHYAAWSQDGSLKQILKTLLWMRRLKLKCHEFAILGSLTSIPIAKLAWSKARSFITFDEGIANWNPSSRLYAESQFWLARAYRKLFCVPSLAEIRERIRTHYTSHPDLPNIVDQHRISQLPAWSTGRKMVDRELPAKTYFIGTEIDAIFNPDISRLNSLLQNYKIDSYVRHPRERKPLELGAPLLEMNGLMAEEAIVRDAGDRSIRLIGWPSTVLINLREVESRTMIFPREHKSLLPIIEMARRVGCDIELI